MVGLDSRGAVALSRSPPARHHAMGTMEVGGGI